LKCSKSEGNSLKDIEIEAFEQEQDFECASVWQELIVKFGLLGVDTSEIPADLRKQMEEEAEKILGRPCSG
jgi:hypothetical protein